MRKFLATQPSPVETVGGDSTSITVQAFVLPHKDRLMDSEYTLGAGPAGWTAQQGFYVYRNDRILVSGSWLGLGRHRTWQKEEHCRLARLSIDLGNDQDFEWQLDVKKSSARPPTQFRERLAGIAESARKRSKDVFFHRGVVGPNPQGGIPPPKERPWKSNRRGNSTTYTVNREHPLVAGLMRKLGPFKDEVEALLRVVEETVPVERIWLDIAEEPGGYSVPYEGLPETVVKGDLQKTFEILKFSGFSTSTAVEFLKSTEPFNRYLHLVEKLKE
jgi:hypothetical protein